MALISRLRSDATPPLTPERAALANAIARRTELQHRIEGLRAAQERAHAARSVAETKLEQAREAIERGRRDQVEALISGGRATSSLAMLRADEQAALDDIAAADEALTRIRAELGEAEQRLTWLVGNDRTRGEIEAAATAVMRAELPGSQTIAQLREEAMQTQARAVDLRNALHWLGHHKIAADLHFDQWGFLTVPPSPPGQPPRAVSIPDTEQRRWKDLLKLLTEDAAAPLPD